MSEETAIMLLEHTGYDDFNLEEHQIKGRLEAIEVLIKQNKQLEKRIKKAIEYIKEHVKLLPDEEGGGLELCDYDVANILEILRGEFNE